jgi:hypothetical protein
MVQFGAVLHDGRAARRKGKQLIDTEPQLTAAELEGTDNSRQGFEEITWSAAVNEGVDPQGKNYHA